MPRRIAWVVAGGLIACGVLGAASIGLPFVPLGAGLFTARARGAGRRVDGGSVLAGAGFVLIAVGILNLGLALGALLLGLGVATFALGRVLCHRQAA